MAEMGEGEEDVRRRRRRWRRGAAQDRMRMRKTEGFIKAAGRRQMSGGIQMAAAIPTRLYCSSLPHPTPVLLTVADALLMGIHTRLRHFLLFQIKHSPLAPKIVGGRGWVLARVRGLQAGEGRRRRQPINAFLANGAVGTSLGRPAERPFLFVTHYKPPPPADMSLSRSSRNHWRHFWRPPWPGPPSRAKQSAQWTIAIFTPTYKSGDRKRRSFSLSLSPLSLSSSRSGEGRVIRRPSERGGLGKKAGDGGEGRARAQEVREGSERRRRQ